MIRRRDFIGAALLLAALTAGLAQQPPQPGVAQVDLGAGPYLFDTAEQHKLRVTVVARDLDDCSLIN